LVGSYIVAQESDIFYQIWGFFLKYFNLTNLNLRGRPAFLINCKFAISNKFGFSNKFQIPNKFEIINKFEFLNKFEFSNKFEFYELDITLTLIGL